MNRLVAALLCAPSFAWSWLPGATPGARTPGEPHLEPEWRLEKIAEHRLAEPRFAAAAVADGDDLYVSGGSHADQWVIDSIERLDLRTGRTEPFGRLQRGRLWHRMVVVAGTLYVLGGESLVRDAEGRKRLRTEATVECLDLRTGLRSFGPPLPEPRRSFGCVRLGGEIYVIGGCRRTDSATEWCRTTLVLEATAGRWRTGPAMTTGREAEAVLTEDSRLVVPGGYDGAGALTVVERLDPRAGTWETLAPLCQPASAHAAARLGPWLLLFGHYDDVAQCLAYDLRRQQSAAFPAPVTGARHAAAVVHRDRIYLVGGRTAESSDGFAVVQVLAARASH